MQIDYALILSAGLGTRMGAIGRAVPKVLWPIYFKKLIELQINFCEDLGVKKIYINTHFLHEEIVSFLNESGLNKKVTVLHEKTLLDSGGAIHNMAASSEVNYKGNLLLVNGDQFLFFDKKYWDEARQKVEKCRAVLFGIKVDKASSYNETIINDNQLVEITKNESKENDYITYSGLGLLNLDNLKKTEGISRFFETVANYKNERVEMVIPEKFEYWDFGTASIYVENIFKIIDGKNQNSEMYKFLEKHIALGDQLNLFINTKKNALDFEYKGMFLENCIKTKDIIQAI